MTGATLFSGILCPEVAMPWVNWRFCAEVDPFACSVIKHRAPGVPNLCDVTADDFVERAKAVGPIDLLVGGAPCQAFSVAGLRKSLDDARGNLTLRFVEIMNAIQPRFILFENVPGILNTADNAFGCLLAGLVGADAPLLPAEECGGRWTDAGIAHGPVRTAAWVVRDAQYAGVPQRRRRVFVLAGRTGDWPHPAAVLFVAQGLQGDSAPGKETRQDVAPTISARTKGGGGLGTDFDLDGGLIASTGNLSHCLNAGGMHRIDYETETLIAHSLRGEGFDASEDGTGRGIPLVPIAFNLRGREDGAQAEVSDVASIRAASGGSSRSYVAASGVRRLLPTECEALMGLPRNWTLVPVKKVKRSRLLSPDKERYIERNSEVWQLAADGPRYKACGNGMAVPVVREIGECLRQCVELVEQQKAEAAA